MAEVLNVWEVVEISWAKKADESPFSSYANSGQ